MGRGNRVAGKTVCDCGAYNTFSNWRGGEIIAQGTRSTRGVSVTGSIYSALSCSEVVVGHTFGAG